MADQPAEKPKKKADAAAPAARAPRRAAARPVSALTVQALAKYVRMAPRKLRLVIDAIRGKSVNEARNILNFSNKRAARTLMKVLNSAAANAENNHRLNPDSLFVAVGHVDQGPTFKSWIPRARGRASAVHKKTSHITIKVRER